MSLLDDLSNPNDPFIKKNLEIKGIDPSTLLKSNLYKKAEPTVAPDPYPQSRNPIDDSQAISVRYFPPYNRKCPNQIMGLIHFAYHCASNTELPHKNLTKWLEIGSLVGESASVFLSFPFVQKLYCVDILFQPDFWSRMDLDIKNKRCEPVEKRSEMASLDFADNSLDVLYIDGDHSEAAAARDLNNWLCKVRPGGWIGVHDYVGDWNDVKPTVDQFLIKNSSMVNRHSYKTFRDGSFCFQKAKR